ncbi:MAG TPA: hypothetical protein VNJ08_10205 [Bacteriovoracaceae bacterium]|nr:hypothetical protein [Bacteriovoracaceae bacterium]
MKTFLLFGLIFVVSMNAFADVAGDASHFMDRVKGRYQIAHGSVSDIVSKDSNGEVIFSPKMAKYYENTVVTLSFKDRAYVQVIGVNTAQGFKTFGNHGLYAFDEEESVTETRTTNHWIEYVSRKKITKRSVSAHRLQYKQVNSTRSSRFEFWKTRPAKELTITENADGSLDMVYVNFEDSNTALKLHLQKAR